MPFVGVNTLVRAPVEKVGAAAPLVKKVTPKVDGVAAAPLVLDTPSSPTTPKIEPAFQNVNVAPPKFKEVNTLVIPKDLPAFSGPPQAGYHDSGGAPYSALLYDPTYLHVDCETNGNNLIAVPDKFAKVWLLMLTGPSGTPVYDYENLGKSSAIYDARNGLDNKVPCNPQPDGFPDDTHPNAVMFSSQSAARAAFFEIVEGIHSAAGLDFNRNFFYAPPRMPHFNWRDDIDGTQAAFEWDDVDNTIAVCSTENEWWNFGKGGATVQYVSALSRVAECSQLGGITVIWGDPETGDNWYAECFADCTTRVAYITRMQNYSLNNRLIKKCNEAYYNWVAALANAIGDTIKGIINIIVGIITLNIGAITKAVEQIVSAWYKFADAQAALDAAKDAVNKGPTKLEMVDQFKKLASGKVDYQLADGSLNLDAPNRRLPAGAASGNLAPLILVGGALLLAQ